MDNFTRLVISEFQRAARDREEYTLPWLNLDTAAYRACRAETGPLPAPYRHDPAMSLILEGVQGLDVLCLAGGGGQQSAVFALLGARVTVLDLMESQLEGDRAAAGQYGYEVTTVQGDMRDLSPLPAAGFDRVCQPISTLYAPDLNVVYQQVQRVLKPGGLYYSDYAFPLLYMAQNLGWDSGGFTLRVTETYQRGEVRELPDGRMSFTEGQPIGETHHRLSDILNGLITHGLRIRGVWESPRPDVPLELQSLPEGMAEEVRYLPFGLSIVAEKE